MALSGHGFHPSGVACFDGFSTLGFHAVFQQHKALRVSGRIYASTGGPMRAKLRS